MTQLYTPEERKAERFKRVCEGKRTYEDYREAHKEAKRLRKKHQMKMRPYECLEFCGKWHLGHNRHGGQKVYLELQEIVDFQREHGYKTEAL